MIYFITNKKIHQVKSSSDITIVDSNSGLQLLVDYIKELSCIGYDKETTSLDPFTAQHLLDAFGDEKNQFVIDMTSVSLKGYEDILINKITVGHNLAYDYSVNLASKKYHNMSVININKLYDTMLVEQRLGLGSKRDNDLASTYQRRLGYNMETSKSTRSQFVGMNPDYVQFTEEQIRYSAGDISSVILIKDIQKNYIEYYNMNLLMNIEFNCLKPLVGCMIEGFKMNEDVWLEFINENKKSKEFISKELDEELLKLGYKQPDRKSITIKQQGLFDNIDNSIDNSYEISNKNIKNINYGSTDQVCNAIRQLNLPVPNKEERGSNYSDIVYKDSISEEVLELYRYEYPDTPLKNFIDLLLQYKEKEKALNSFGDKFLNELLYNPSNTKKSKLGYKRNLTGKVHTVYRQCVTENGRLASGNTKLGLFNSQQIPKEKKIRNCFISDNSDYKILTLDLSGAELIILGALAKDKKLIKLQSEDIHSYLATKGYSKIINTILNRYDPQKYFDKVYDELSDLLKPNKIYRSLGDLSSKDKQKLLEERIAGAIENRSFTVNKESSKDIRDPFKNVVYGVSYGATSTKIGKTLRIREEYADLILKSMNEELPDTFRFLDQASKSGVKNGYIIFNDRTNSRHWFRKALDAKDYGYELTRSEKGDIERACKNYRKQICDL